MAHVWGNRRKILLRWVVPALVLLSAALSLAPAARAQIGSARYSSIIVDAASGDVLEAVNPDAPRHPASLAKLMTLYMAFEALKAGRIGLNQPVPVSYHAASMEPSKLGLRPGGRLTVNEAILAIVTKSANDAACALGELIGGGDEARFAEMMTLRARALGMTHSTFRNASGLPDPRQISTARDLALLAHHLIADYPDQYYYFSVPDFRFQGRIIPNHDRMLQNYEGADGLKTGYTLAAGHNLVTSAQRGGVRLIGVVLGAATNTERDLHMASLLDDGFLQLGVPVTRHAPPKLHLPSLFASAEAAPLRPAFGHLRLMRIAAQRHPESPHGHRQAHVRASLAAVHVRMPAAHARATGCGTRAHHHCAVATATPASRIV
jgi:D-alanyl-D-alanine carboxypeptidase